MTWLIILAVLAAAFGPVAYLRPSKRDRVLTELRAAARKQGIIVELTQVPKLAALAHERVTSGGVERIPNLACVAYTIHPQPRPEPPVRYRLLRQPNTEYPVAHTLSQWELDRSFAAAAPLQFGPLAPADYWRAVADIVEQLPADTVAIAVTDTACSCYWQETLNGLEPAASVAALAAALQNLAALQTSGS